MVGSAATLKGAGLVVPGILITLKLLVLPVVTREVVSLINAGVDANDTISLSNYGEWCRITPVKLQEIIRDCVHF